MVQPAAASTVDPIESVRHPEAIRLYHLGRYADPQHPDVMHEQHPFYRVESVARWNLRPGTATVQGPTGPHMDVAFSPPPSNDAIVAELNRQKEATERVMREASQLAASYVELQKVIQDMTVVAKNHGWMASKVLEGERRVKELENELRKLSTTLVTPATAPGPTTNEPAEPFPIFFDPLLPLSTARSNSLPEVR